MARFVSSAFTAAAALLGISSAGSAAECRYPDPDPQRAPIRENGIPFHVTVENVRSAEGNIVITLYGNNPRRWLEREGSLHIYTVRALAPTTGTCIVLPGLNQYAIGVYHDRNGNGHIDRRDLKVLGRTIARDVPTEDGGLSNNPWIALIWPSLRSSLMDVNQPGMRTTIRLRRPPI